MSDRGRSPSPRNVGDAGMDVDRTPQDDKANAKVVIVTNLTRNVVEAHLRTIFGFYGSIVKLDLPLYGKSGQNRGKAALEYVDSTAAHKAHSHMDGGQLDGAVLKVELSNLPVRSRSPSPRRVLPPRRGGRPRSPSFSRSRSPPPYRRREPPFRDTYRGRGGSFGRRGPPGRDTYRPRSISRSRSRSPIRRGGPLPPRRRSPSYTRGGYGRGRRSSRSRSRSYSVRSSRSRTRSLSPSRSRTRSRSASYSSYSSYSRGRSRTRSLSPKSSRSPSPRGKRSLSRDDIRDSRSRSPKP